MYRLLVVDDEERIRNVIREYAEFNGFDVEEAVDGAEAVEKCRNEEFDIIVMDIMMPKFDGYSACKEIKKIKNIPTILLSARTEEYDKLFGFEIGIDDYVTKPFSPKELIARVNAVLTRHKASAVVEEKEKSQYVYKGLEVDMKGRSVKVDGKSVDLTPKEYDLLFYLIKNEKIALSRENLLREVWGYDFFGEDRTVDTHVKNLRNALGDYRDLIVTLRGVGYKFEV